MSLHATPVAKSKLPYPWGLSLRTSWLFGAASIGLLCLPFREGARADKKPAADPLASAVPTNHPQANLIAVRQQALGSDVA
jgi:hypothetical protein